MSELPQAKELERAIVGGLLAMPDAIGRLEASLPEPTGETFSDKRALAIYEVILELYRAGLAIDVVTVGDALSKRDGSSPGAVWAELTGLLGACPSGMHLESYLRLLGVSRAKRRLALGLAPLSRIAFGNTHTSSDEVIGAAESVFEGIRSGIPLSEPERTYSIAELARIRFETADYLLSVGLLPAGGLTLLAGDCGAGKSISALDLSLAMVSGGGPAWNTEASPGSVLYLGADNSTRELQRNVVKLAEARGLILGDELPMTLCLERFPLDKPDGLSRLDGMMRARAPKLCVIDTLGAYSSDTDLNDYASVGRLLGGIRALADRYGSAVVLIHHLNKAAGPLVRRLLDRVNGSVALVGSVNDVLALTVDSVGGELVRTLTLCKGRDEPVSPVSFVMQSGPEGGLVLAYRAGDETLAERSLVERVRASLAEALEQAPGRGFSRKDLELIIAGLGLKAGKRTLDAAVSGLRALPAVEVKREGKGLVYRWRLPELPGIREEEE